MCLRAAADGFNPPIERIVANLRALGHASTSTTRRSPQCPNTYPPRRGRGTARRPPQGFDAAYLRHQLPGGMVGTMRRHLAGAACRNSKAR